MAEIEEDSGKENEEEGGSKEEEMEGDSSSGEVAGGSDIEEQKPTKGSLATPLSSEKVIF